MANLHRRSFLGGALAACPASLALAPRPAPLRSPVRRARNLIFMVADGMSMGTLTLADMLSRQLHGEDSASNWVRLWNRPGVRRASQATYSADSLVTDSAAAASAWGIGRRVNNGAVNITPDGVEHEPILPWAAKTGRATGLVTTTRVTHATPAGFIANVPKREMETEIARQILDRRVDAVLGGGAAMFHEEHLQARPSLEIVRTRDELLRAPIATRPGPILGLFAPQHLSFSLDRAPAEPTLAEMAQAAVARLDARPAGFVLQIEGGRVDHGAHENDAGGMLFDQLAFDECLGWVMGWLGDRDDTLLIVTSDHGNANPGLTYYEKEGRERFARVSALRHSFEWIGARIDSGAGSPRDIIAEATGIALDDAELDMLRRSADGQRVDPFELSNRPLLVLGSILANHLGVSFMSPNHTSDFTEVTALGPGSESMPSMLDNTDLHAMALAALEPDRAPASAGGPR